MKISDNAREALKALIEENGADGLRAGIQETCCGKNPVIALDTFEEGEEPELFNEVPMVILPEAKGIMDQLEIDLVNGELVILSTVQGCGCGGHHHEEGHECCGGHHHEEGHECCGGHHHEDGHECCGGHHHHE